MLVFVCAFQKGQGPPGREPVFSEEQRKQMTAYAYRKQEELKVSVPSYQSYEHQTVEWKRLGGTDTDLLLVSTESLLRYS